MAANGEEFIDARPEPSFDQCCVSGRFILKCRFCQHDLHLSFADLGFAPPSNAYLELADLSRPERFYPLRVKTCTQCWLVQTEDYAEAGAFFNASYAYFSSTSAGWLAHAKIYCDEVTQRLNLGPASFVIEVASNDGYLLKNFVDAGIPCLGIEPTASTAEAAVKIGVPTLQVFFGAGLAQKLAEDGRKADLIIGNNVFAHVPDINDFTRGLALALKAGGTITLEFPHLARLIAAHQFDTIYHEHFSYFSLRSAQAIFAAHGLRIFDVEELPTHGGSLRIFGCHKDDPRPSANVEHILKAEHAAGLQKAQTYENFQTAIEKVKNDVVAFLIEAKRAGKKVVAYGAAAKGNTLLNYAGIRPDLISFVCDAAPSKQGKFMPGSHIPILAPMALEGCNADYILILPWNIASEVISKTRHMIGPHARYVVAVPELTIL
jgi:SAM-dependent methyltransferase